MSSFDRLGNVVKGALSNAAGDVERNNAAAVFEAAIETRIERLAEYTKAAAGLGAQRDRLIEEVRAHERDLAELSTPLQMAQDDGDADTARLLQASRLALTNLINQKTAQLLPLAEQVGETKSALQNLRQTVEELKRERTAALAQLASAEAMIDVQDSMSGFSDKASERALASVRESVSVLHSRAHKGYLDSEGNSVRGKLAAMEEKSAAERARDKLERLKKQYAEERE